MGAVLSGGVSQIGAVWCCGTGVLRANSPGIARRRWRSIVGPEAGLARIVFISADAMDDRTEDFLKWVKADQEEAELDYRRINRVQTEAFALLRGLSNNWQPAVDMAGDPRERTTAVMLLIRSGCIEAKFGLSLYSDAPAVRAQAIVTGYYHPGKLLEEAQRHFSRFLRGTVSVQADTKWDLRLTSEGEHLKFDLQKHPENDWIAWHSIEDIQATPHVDFRLLDALSGQGPTVAVAGAHASASVGNVVVQNQDDWAALIDAVRQSVRPSPQGSCGNSGKQERSGSMEQLWVDDAPEYLPLSEAVKLTDGRLSLSALSRLLTPQGHMRYMRKGQRCRVHLGDFRRFLKGHQSDPRWAKAYMAYLSAAGKGDVRFYWRCKACGHEHPEGSAAQTDCPGCGGECEILRKRPPEPKR